MIEGRLKEIDEALYHLHPDSQAAEKLEAERVSLVDGRLYAIEKALHCDRTAEQERRELTRESLKLRGVAP